MTHGRFLLICLALGMSTAHAAPVPGPVPVEGRGLAELAAELAAGRVTSEALVSAYLARIEAVDRHGPTLRAVLATNPHALDDARASDAARQTGHVRGRLEGLPILIKDNIETADPMATTAGSLALAANFSGRDAPLVARLRAAGAIILGKTNLSEWANIRGSRAISGWSGVGGLTRNPYALDRSSCGSSTGSGAAMAASLAAGAVGTETDGSVTCPASVNGIVGFKPTLGLVSRTHIVPIAHSQDTAGPMGRSVTDVAQLLTVMAGSDPDDAATAAADTHKVDFAAGLDAGALQGKRLGVLRFLAGFHPETDAMFSHALEVLRHAGAELVVINDLPGYKGIGEAEGLVLITELKADLDAYLGTTPNSVQARSLDAVISFNEAHGARELALFGQEMFARAANTKGLNDPDYLAALATSKRLAGAEGIDKMLADQKLDALVAPTSGPAWVVDWVNGDNSLGSTPTLAAVAGYPHLSVPMGTVSGLPVGLSIMGPAWADARILAYGYAFEQAMGLAQKPTYPPSVPLPAAGAALLAPVAR